MPVQSSGIERSALPWAAVRNRPPRATRFARTYVLAAAAAAQSCAETVGRRQRPPGRQTAMARFSKSPAAFRRYYYSDEHGNLRRSSAARTHARSRPLGGGGGQ